LCHGCEPEARPEPLRPEAREQLAEAYRQLLARRAAGA
jgi:hypothetical protein